MIIGPDHLLEAFATAGANRISVHWEPAPTCTAPCKHIHDLGCRAGVAINPHTPAAFLSEILHLIDAVLVMTVNPGFGGQKFLTETLPKIAQLASMIQGRDISIVVDGGINASTAAGVVGAGAQTLVVGSAVFNQRHSVLEGMESLRHAVGIKKPG